MAMPNKNDFTEPVVLRLILVIGRGITRLEVEGLEEHSPQARSLFYKLAPGLDELNRACRTRG